MSRVRPPRRMMRGMLTLYYAPGTCALATHLALEYAGAPYQTERLDFGSGEQRSPAYLEINPKGRVPTLVTEHGPLTETPALLLYVAQCFPAANLAPLDNPFLLAKAQAFNSYLCATVHVNHAHGRRAARWADDPAAQAAMRAKVPQTMAESFELIEQQLFAGPWVLGEQFSICDPYLFTLSGWLKVDQVDIERFPQVAAHRRRMEADPRVQKVLSAHTG